MATATRKQVHFAASEPSEDEDELRAHVERANTQEEESEKDEEILPRPVPRPTSPPALPEQSSFFADVQENRNMLQNSLPLANDISTRKPPSRSPSRRHTKKRIHQTTKPNVKQPSHALRPTSEVLKHRATNQTSNGAHSLSSPSKLVDPRLRRLFNLRQYERFGSNIRPFREESYPNTHTSRTLSSCSDQRANNPTVADELVCPTRNISKAYIKQIEMVEREKFNPHAALSVAVKRDGNIVSRIRETATSKALNVHRHALQYVNLTPVDKENRNSHYLQNEKSELWKYGKDQCELSNLTKACSLGPSHNSSSTTNPTSTRITTARAKKSTSLAYLKSLEAKPNIDDFRPTNMEVDVISIPYPHIYEPPLRTSTHPTVEPKNISTPFSNSASNTGTSTKNHTEGWAYPQLSISSLSINLEDTKRAKFYRKMVGIDDFFFGHDPGFQNGASASCVNPVNGVQPLEQRDSTKLPRPIATRKIGDPTE